LNDIHEIRDTSVSYSIDPILNIILQITNDEIVAAEPEFTSTPPGSGPRHLAIDEAREHVYVLHELKSLIEIYKINPNTGELTLMSAVDLLAESPIPPEVWNYPFQVPSFYNFYS
jgi:6-phosphogluconolactonase (cycloisomerase 2 family)